MEHEDIIVRSGEDPEMGVYVTLQGLSARGIAYLSRTYGVRRGDTVNILAGVIESHFDDLDKEGLSTLTMG